MSVFLMILGAYLIYLVQKWLFIANWDKGLTADFGFIEDAVREGDTAHMTETLVNRKRLPLFALQVKVAITPFFRFEEMENTIVTDQNYRNDIYVLNGYEKVTRTLPFTCLRRGFFTVSSLELISSDLFHVHRLARRIPQNKALYVYPSPADQERTDILFRQILGIMLTRRYSLEDPFEIRGIREYRSGDPMKDINWKVSAHRDDWMVNQHQYTASQHVRILLNLERDSNWKYEKLFEESIRIAASMAELFLQEQIPVALRSNAFDAVSGEHIDEAAGAGEMHEETMLRALARIDEDRDPSPFADILEEELSGRNEGATYILISYTQNAEELSVFDSLCSPDAGSMRIAVLHPDMEFRDTHMQNAAASVWEVPYA